MVPGHGNREPTVLCAPARLCEENGSVTLSLELPPSHTQLIPKNTTTANTTTIINTTRTTTTCTTRTENTTTTNTTTINLHSYYHKHNYDNKHNYDLKHNYDKHMHNKHCKHNYHRHMYAGCDCGFNTWQSWIHELYFLQSVFKPIVCFLIIPDLIICLWSRVIFNACGQELYSNYIINIFDPSILYNTLIAFHWLNILAKLGRWGLHKDNKDNAMTVCAKLMHISLIDCVDHTQYLDTEFVANGYCVIITPRIILQLDMLTDHRITDPMIYLNATPKYTLPLRDLSCPSEICIATPQKNLHTSWTFTYSPTAYL